MSVSIAALLTALYDAEVEFLIVGGYGAWLQGSRIITSDLDVCYRRSNQNISRLVKALQPLHPKLRGAEDIRFLLDERTISQGMNFTLLTDFGDLDLLGQLAGVGGFDEMITKAKETEVNGMRIKLASLEDIIASKRAAGRDKDKFALPELEGVLRAQKEKEKPR